MKKYLISILLSAVLLPNIATANDGVYVGGDLVLSKAQYKYNDKYNYPQGIYPQQSLVSQNAVGAGLSVGYKKSFAKNYIASEVFYDYLNSSSKDYYHTIIPYQQDSLNLRSRYGVKADLGHDFTQKFSAYVTYGFANVSYLNAIPSLNYSEGKSKLSQLYGLGALFEINENWAARIEFNEQRFHTRYSIDGEGVINKVRLDVLKTGLVYSF
jgi:opacity protein-like surface antigen